MTKAATVVVAATHNQRFLPPSFQLVSSTFLTAASLTAVSASAWAGAKAVLTSRSKAEMVPRAMGDGEDIFTDLLGGAFGQMVTAGEISAGGREPWATAVSAEVRRDGGLGDFATAGT